MQCFYVKFSPRGGYFSWTKYAFGLFFQKQSFHPAEVVGQRCSVEKVYLEFVQNSQENTCARISFLIKLQACACNFVKKENLTQVFSSEFCEIFMNTFSYRTPLQCCFWSSQYFCYFPNSDSRISWSISFKFSVIFKHSTSEDETSMSF